MTADPSPNTDPKAPVTLLLAPPAGRADEFSQTGKTIVYVILIALLIRMFAFEPFNIPSTSMVPNLLVGDYLFVSKYAYGYSSLSSFMGLLPFKGRLMETAPKRGDVVVFKLPKDPHVDYIKRLIGLPGDTIQMRHGLLYINGAPAMRERLPVFVAYDYLVPAAQTTDYKETFPEGTNHAIRKEGDDHMLDDTPPFVVPEGHYFFMGDNRDHSLDSRTTNVGFVPRDNLVGRAEFLFFSIDSETASSFWKIPGAIRWGRLFMKIR